MLEWGHVADRTPCARSLKGIKEQNSEKEEEREKKKKKSDEPTEPIFTNN